MDYRHIALILGILAISIICSGCVSETADTPDLTYYTEQYPPYNYEYDGTLHGIAVDLLVEMTGRMGTPVDTDSIMLVPWTEGYQKTLDGTDTILFSTVRLPEREELFKWAGPIATERKVLFARGASGISIDEPADLSGYRIGVVTDDAAIGELAAIGVDPAALIDDPDPDLVLRMLLDGEIDLFAYGKAAGEYIAREETGGVRSIEVVYQLGENEIYYAFSRDTPDEVVQEFQQALDTLREETGDDGVSTYEHIVGKYESASALLSLTYLTEEFAPLNYAENGELKGVAVDLLGAIFDDSGTGLTVDDIEFIVWRDGYSKALNDSGIVLFSTARRPSREGLFKWAGPFISSGNALIADTARDIRINDASELEDLRIGVITDTSSIILLEGLGIGKESLIMKDSGEELIAMLDDGSIDAWATGELSGLHLIGQYSSHPQSYAAIYTLGTNNYYYAFSKDTPGTTVAAFQEALDSAMTVPDETGITEYQRILYRYLEPGCAEQTVTPAEAMELVELTAADIGKDASGTISRINAGEHPYRDAGNPAKYVFVYDTKVTLVADGGNPGMVGHSLQGTTDVAGTPFRDRIVQGALLKGSGWTDYIFTSPSESGLFYKSAYYTLVEGSDGESYIVCCGIYKACE